MIELGRLTRLVAAMAVAVGTFAANNAAALPVSCPEISSGIRLFSANTNPDAACYAYGPGNLNGNGDQVLKEDTTPPTTYKLSFIENMVLIDKSDGDGTDGITPFNWLQAVSGSLTSGTSGVLSFTLPTGYVKPILGFKTGNGQLDPDWAAFLIPDAAAVGGVWNVIWSVSGSQALSHVNLYAQVGDPVVDPRVVVPLPAAAWLLLGGLGGLGLIGRRRKAAEA